MTEIQKRLSELSDEKYAVFQANLIPGINRDTVIGVRLPELRMLAKEINGTPSADSFLCSLPHDSYDENILHGKLIEKIKDYNECMAATERFLPFVDNWAVCDTFTPQVFALHKTELLEKIRVWIKSDKTYTVRYAVRMLMTFYLDDDFNSEYPSMASSVQSKEYYVNMMIAWYFATALAKQWDAVIPFIENATLVKWTHNKTIQKAVESYRIPDERKTYLKTLKIK